MTQADLFTPPTGPADGDASTLYGGIKGLGWVSVADCAKAQGWPARRVRQARRDSAGWLISAPGSKGICRVSEATLSECLHAANAKAHQGRDMIKDAESIRDRAMVHARRVT